MSYRPKPPRLHSTLGFKTPAELEEEGKTRKVA
jgi:hypothetical protein